SIQEGKDAVHGRAELAGDIKHMSLAPGARLGPYEIQSPLGVGGMGEVYKARDTRLDRTVALKILPESLAADPQFRERFDREARAKLLDFGLAKTAAPAVSGAGLSMLPTTPRGLTAQGTILGTFQYMAPEQVEGKDADARSDIFSFGALVYEMVTGKRAFEGNSAPSVVAAILEREPPRMSSLQPLTPVALAHIVSRCLAKDPDERWQRMSDVMRELKWIADAELPDVTTKGAGPLLRAAWI